MGAPFFCLRNPLQIKILQLFYVFFGRSFSFPSFALFFERGRRHKSHIRPTLFQYTPRSDFVKGKAETMQKSSLWNREITAKRRFSPLPLSSSRQPSRRFRHDFIHSALLHGQTSPPAAMRSAVSRAVQAPAPLPGKSIKVQPRIHFPTISISKPLALANRTLGIVRSPFSSTFTSDT